MSLAISNLVENAVKYNNEGGYVKVTLNADHQYFYLTVEDNGIGIPEQDIPRIFDRFYRAHNSGAFSMRKSLSQNRTPSRPVLSSFILWPGTES